MVLTPEKIEEIKQQLQGLSPEEQKAKLQEILQTLPEEDREQLVSKPQCPFCLMAEGKIDTKKIYEDEDVLAVLDINPATKGHTLVFTKKHYQFLGQVDDHDLLKLMKAAKKVSEALLSALKATGTSIVIKNGPGAGQVSPHLLVNVIPRYDNDNVSLQWNPQKTDDAKLNEIASKLSSAIPKEETPIISEEKLEIEKEENRIP